MAMSKATRQQIVWDLIQKAGEDAMRALTAVTDLVDDPSMSDEIMLGCVAAFVQVGACEVTQTAAAEVDLRSIVAYALAAASYAARASDIAPKGGVIVSATLVDPIVDAWTKGRAKVQR